MIRALATLALAVSLIAVSAAASLVFVRDVYIDAYYPPRALDQEVEGKTKVKCVLNPNGWLSGCAVVSETPLGYGFGQAGINLVTSERVDIGASGLEASVGKALSIPLTFLLPEAPPFPSTPSTAPSRADGDGETPGAPEGEYEDHADGRQFVEGVELTAEDHAARQVHSSTPAETACPERSGCVAGN